MVQSTLTKPNAKPTSLARWLYRQLGQPGLKLKTQQRGNVLHVLLEGQDCPPKPATLGRLIERLQDDDWGDRVTCQTAPVYKLIVYGRARGEALPRWSQSIHLNQLDRYAHWLAVPAADPDEVDDLGQASLPIHCSPPETAAIVRSNRSQAQQGDPEAIARHLSDRLSALGVAVRVAIKPADPSVSPAIALTESKRLWVLCESDYSINPTATAEWMAQELRGLGLEGFQDAAVFSQVKGETKPDWSLRVDLTPPEELLRQWSRWGDVKAIALLLNRQLQPQQCSVEAQLHSKTLHLFCRSTAQPAHRLAASELRDRLADLLTELAPQGIHAASLYGLAPQAATPMPVVAPDSLASPLDPPAAEPLAEDVATVGDAAKPPAAARPAVAPPPGVDWLEWLALPAADHGDLSSSTLTLAEQGDLTAAGMLLNRLLNPDLEAQLTTGGTRVQLLRKGDLLHVMCDAPRCPRRKQISRPVAKYIRQLRLPKIAGLRIYGRRAGQAQPRWQYGRDFVPRDGDGELAPQFAVAEASGDLLTQDAAALGLARAPWGLGRGLSLDSWRWGQGQLGPVLQPWLDQAHQLLVRSHLFVPRRSPSLASAAIAAQPSGSAQTSAIASGARVAFIWAALGLLVALSGDVVLGKLLRQGTAAPAAPEAVDLATGPNTLGDTLLTPENTADSFASGGAIQPRPSDLPQIAALMADYPSFNNPLFDEKLALYRQRVAEEGPPDILVVGSSRALRGIDPSALTSGLAAIGKQDVTVFNFSINGSTAQVVELQLLMLLHPEHRPGLIIWADGARAFNSGREDATYQAVASSEAFRKLSQNQLPNLFRASGTNEPTPLQRGRTSLTGLLNLQGLNAALDRALGRLSAVHGQRDQLKTAVAQLYAQGFDGLQPSNLEALALEDLAPDAPEGEGLIDFDGFMPLSVRFNPATYYQRYSRVTGKYDGDYQSFRMEGAQMKSLEGVLQLTSQYDIPLVFVNLPLTADYLDPVRLRYESIFQKHMFKRMTQCQLIFRDLSQLWPEAVDNFSDPSHLNQYGAREVSVHLAQDPMIPWPQLSSQ